MLKYPIGYSDFRDIIQEERVLVDKTLMIPQIMDDAKVLLFTRPRRFGKTLNLSMLRYFFSCQEENTANLFKGLNIYKAPKSCWQHQGKYPVIFLTLKDIKSSNYTNAYESICNLLARVYREHRILLESDTFLDADRNYFLKILNQEAPLQDVKAALQTLCVWLFERYGEKPLLLIDEYDTPIHTAYVRDYYADMVDFMREFLGVTLKDDSHFYKAVITGILRVSKENLFSGLNNIEVYSFLSPEYAEYFGFTEEEVNVLFKKAGLKHDAEKIRAWYNGYQIDGKTLYNPWSIISCIKNGGKLSPYWVNTSDNALIGKLLAIGGKDIQEDFEVLMQGQTVESELDEHLTFVELNHNREGILNLLFMAGYLNALVEEETEEEPVYKLRIPNQEVRTLYRRLIFKWLGGNEGRTWVTHLLRDLRDGELASFEKKLSDLLWNALSYYDVKGHEPEKFFHGFTLGLVADMHKEYVIKSNRESGEGRYDVALIPKDKKAGLQGFIFEIKSVDSADQDELKLHAQKALEQIEALGYDQEMKAQNVNKLTKIGMAFSGKKIAMASRVAA